MSDLVNMVGGTTSAILNSGSVSRYDGLYDVNLVLLQTHAGKQQRVAFCWNWWFKLIANHITVQC
jgi:hypothetical protein